VVVRNARQLAALRRAGSATIQLLGELTRLAAPGVATRELDDFAAEYIRRIGGQPIFNTQNNFPACINTSINEEAVHGVPGQRVLEAGDLLSIDCGIGLGGYCGDATITIGVGPADQLSSKRRHVLEVAREALKRGIAVARAGSHVGDIGEAMQTYVEAEGCRLLPQYTGHGLGRRLWEEPQIPAVGRRGIGPVLADGLVITIEPIVVAGRIEVEVGADGWTVRTRDGEPVAQFEHTILVSRNEARILTAPYEVSLAPVVTRVR
jgi:methionyl aminopeptidase